MSRKALLLVPALLALTAWAPAAQALVKTKTLHNNAAPKKAAPAQKAPAEKAPAVKTYEFTHETVKFPGYWKASEKTSDLVRSEFYYQWDKPDRECTTDAYPWAYAVISNDISPCWHPDAEYFDVVRQVQIAGTAGTLYRHKPVKSAADSDTESCPGQSYMAVVFAVEGHCYNMKFITREKYVKTFFPDFKLIMDNFEVVDRKPANSHKKGPAVRQDGILP